MAEYEYAITAGFDTEPDPDADNIEVYFVTNPLRGKRVTLGSTTTKSQDGYEITDGWQTAELTTEACYFSELEDYMDAIHGGFDGDENVEATLHQRQRDNTFEHFNVIAHMPKEPDDYEHWTTTEIQNLRLRYTVIEPATIV